MNPTHGLSRAATILIALVVLVIGTSCAVQTRSDTQTRQNNGVIVIRSDADASVIVDDGVTKTVAAGKETPIPVPPGARRIEVVSENHLSRRFDVDVEANEAVIIDVQMWPRVEELDDAE